MKPVGAGSAALVALLVAGAAGAAPVRLFRTQSAEAFAKGESEAIAIDAAGVVSLAPAAEKVATIDEPFAFSFVPYGRGWAIGTGSDGRVLAIDEKGKSRILFDAEEPEIFALAAIDGALFAGSSPAGKLYKISTGSQPGSTSSGADASGAGSAEVWFDPPEGYVWGIAPAQNGALWVATGAPGKLYRVTAKGKAEVVWEGATHVRSLLPLPDGDLLFGTAGDGRLLRWRAGQVRTLHDSELTEVAALAPGADGSVWIALLASESSFVDLGGRPAGTPAEGEETKAALAADDDESAGSRPPGALGPRSELLHLLANGSVESVWSSADETLFALLPEGDGVWAATGLEGRLYRIDGVGGGRARVERKFEPRQLVGLARATEGPAVLTTNGASLWRLIERREAKGTYTSAVLDAGQVSAFGVFRWQGTAPSGARLRASFRSGFAAEPDTTWSPWSEPREGQEIPLDAIERGRFVQYRLELSSAGGTAPRVASTEISYRQENLRPAIQSFQAMEPGQIQVAAGFNPADQLYEPASPNREGIFDTLKPTPPRGERLRTVWRKGWLTLRWEVADPNGDTLEHELEVRPESQPDGWLELASEVEESVWTFDATALPDGLYRFRLTSSDAPGNQPAAGSESGALEAARESEPVVVDNSPPILVAVERHSSTLVARLEDAWSPIREAELSIDGAGWKPARVKDGLLDGKSETLEVTGLPAGSRLVLLRVVDAAFNVRTFDLLSEKGSAAGAR